MQLSVVEQSNNEITNLLYGQSNRVAISHLLTAAIVIVWYSNVAPLEHLLIWGAAVVFFVASRLALHRVFKRYNNNENNHLWMHALAGMTSVMACLYSFAFIYFTPISENQYVFSVGMAIIALSAVSTLLYSASIYIVLSFFIPITIPTTLYFLFTAGDIGNIFAVMLFLYSGIVLSLLKKVNEVFKKSVLLNFQHSQEIEKRKLIEKQLQDISRRDGLTGLFNRRYFDEVLDVEIGRAHRNHSPLCLIMFDIDYFKEYNDYYGHVAGDSCIIAIAELVEQLANRKGDLCARYGGEEFAIILPNIDITGALAFANKIQKYVQDKRLPHKASKLTTLQSVTVSVGVTNLVPFKKVKAKELIRAADEALYIAKREGRNRVHHKENNGLGHDLSN